MVVVGQGGNRVGRGWSLGVVGPMRVAMVRFQIKTFVGKRWRESWMVRVVGRGGRDGSGGWR